ncbi:MAG: hypothetical protein WDZ48_09325, partial [Pirellulales bacterium]
MNAAPFRHLVWKEYRAVRAFWLSLVVLVIGIQALVLWLSKDPADTTILVCFIALGAPPFFAIGCAG